MNKTRLVQAMVSGGLACAVVPAVAQDGATGMRVILGVEQEIEAGDNLALENPEEGATALSTTTLSLGLLSETSTQSLSLGLAGKLRFGELPSNSDIGTGFVEPSVSLSYGREGANSRLSMTGSYRETDAAFFEPLSSFADETGVIVLPTNFEDRRNTGTRQNYSFSTQLETGIDAPLGFVFDASVSGITYSDGAGATNDDSFRYAYGIESRLRLSPVSTAFVGYDFSHYESDDPADTERDTDIVEIGIAHELSERATIEAAIGYSQTEEEEFGIISKEDGLTGRLIYGLAMPNGTLNVSYRTTRDQNGARNFLRFGRALDLPLGSLSFNIGATQKESGDPKLIGGINWQHELPTGRITLSANRDVSVNEDDDERITTTAAFGYVYQINTLSSLAFDASFGLSEDEATSNDTRRTDLTASYNYALTPDWSLRTGIAYRVRDEDLVGTSDSTSVFVRIGRDFTLFQ